MQDFDLFSLSAALVLRNEDIVFSFLVRSTNFSMGSAEASTNIVESSKLQSLLQTNFLETVA